MSCVEGFFIFTAKGDPIIHRLYKDNIDLRTVSELFRTRVLHTLGNAQTSSPVRQIGSRTIAYLTHRDIHLVAVVKNNANVLMTLTWLSSLIKLFQAYFVKVKEKYIRDNYVLIYELLDEVCDDGVPQITDPSILKEYIFQKGQFFGEAEKKPAADVTVQVTGAVAHRKPNVIYKKNEVYLDIVETTTAFMSNDGTPLRAEVHGRLLLKAFLSGMPECRLGLIDRGAQDVVFASIVNNRDWETNKCVSFIPPDNGNATEFEVMRYRCTDTINVPFKIVPNIVESGRTRVSVDCMVKSLYDPSLTANSIIVMVPVPPQTSKVQPKVTKGKAKYDGKINAIVWKIAKFGGEKEHRLTADITLVSTTREKKPWTRPPVSMQFNVPMFSASPLRVQYFKVHERSNYAVEKWVRKVCKAGNYECRTKQ